MTTLITSDIHLTDRVKDEYRWGLFPWLNEKVNELKLTEILFLGDTCDSKDRHSARLVNRLFDEIVNLSQKTKLIILVGNHDFISLETPFFKFLDEIPNVTFINAIQTINLSIGKAMFVPSGVSWDFPIQQVPYLFTHVTFDGSKAENGSLLPGIDPNILNDYEGLCISGDVHVPQKLRKNIIYCGAPAHMRFGDSFEPRVMVVQNDGSRSDLHYPSPRKYSQVIKSLAELYRIKILEGDQIKIIAEMRRADLPEWKDWRDAIREQADKEGWELFGPELRLQPDTISKTTSTSTRQSNEQLVDEYATKQKTGEFHRRIGRELIKLA